MNCLTNNVKWSRYSGGSGAPLWTYYAMGLDPKAFEITEACMVQSHYEDPEQYPKMFWPTNYARLACQVAFTLFNAGLDFAPKAIIDGKNIEIYLQEHLLNATAYFYNRIISSTDLLNRTIIGVETLNELNRGLVGHENIAKLAEPMHFKLGNTPTPLESMILGMGKPCEVETYEFGMIGPKKIRTTLVDPKGVKAWVSDDSHDKKYGFKRDPAWKLGRCIWAQHGVWDDDTGEALIPDYFKFGPEGQLLTEAEFNEVYFIRYWGRFYEKMRAVDRQMFLFCQPPTMSVPPKLKGSPHMDSRVIYAPHYYDGLTMVQKRWNTWWNVDVLGVLRGRYILPPLALKFGEAAIRDCMKGQIAAMRDEGLEKFGITPCLMSETGMPFDLDDRMAYKTGDYSSQIKAWDTLGCALEGAQIHHTLWVYSAENSHRFGDYWNGEDFSIYCKNHGNLPDPFSPSESVELIVEVDGKVTEAHTSRADRAIARPFPLSVSGGLSKYFYEMKYGMFKLSIKAVHCLDRKHGTEIAIPAANFPEDKFEVVASSGEWEFDITGRILTWWHDEGEQTLEIKSLTFPIDSIEQESWVGWMVRLIYGC